MSVEKMEYVNIVGPVEKIDYFIIKHVIGNEIQLEHAINLVHSIKGLKPFDEEEQLDEIFKNIDYINKYMNVEINECRIDDGGIYDKSLETEAIHAFINPLKDKLAKLQSEIEKTNAQIHENRSVLTQFLPFQKIDTGLEVLLSLEYIKFRLGRFPKFSFNKLDITTDRLDVIVVPLEKNGDYVWAACFMPSEAADRIDAVLSSLYFEEISLPEKIKGSAEDVFSVLEKEIEVLEQKIKQLEKSLTEIVRDEKDRFLQLYIKMQNMRRIQRIKKFAAHAGDIFYMAGWMPDSEYRRFIERLKGQDEFTITVENPEDVVGLKPPTILKNNKFFRPFEALVTMYGIPAHDEIDPTVIIAVTYILMFGAMFGDVGQGAVLMLAGIFIYLKRKMPVGWVLTLTGASSVAFGFLYGSFFGNEHILTPVWKSPMENINNLLFIAVGYGAIMILVSISISIANSIKSRNYSRLVFDKNGLAGLVFYGGALGVIIHGLLTGNMTITLPVIVFTIILPLALMLFREKLEEVLLKKHSERKTKGGFAESFFEVFEAVLGFVSNTISYVRISAFALSHAGLAMAVWTLYDMAKGAGKVIVIIIGNLLIIGPEGLIVAIQCMRLQYYEMFSRFFSGDGKRFQPVSVFEQDHRPVKP